METKNYNQEYYDKLYEELCEVVEEIKPYYSVDKIKDYGVYIWTKKDPNRKENYFDYAENLFDIYADEIIFYVKDHKIPDEVMPIIKKIQSKLLRVEEILLRKALEVEDEI